MLIEFNVNFGLDTDDANDLNIDNYYFSEFRL